MSLYSDTNLSTDQSLGVLESDLVSKRRLIPGRGSVSTTGSSTTLTFTDPLATQDITVGSIIRIGSSEYIVMSIDNDSHKATIDKPVSLSVATAYDVRTWSAKIACAKEIITNAITDSLSSAGYWVDEEHTNLCDLVSNPERFRTASDYLVINMIYMDLASGAKDTDAYMSKATVMWRRYCDELASALKAVNIGYQADGATNTYRNSVPHTTAQVR